MGKYAAVFSNMSSESSVGSVSSLYGGANSISDGIFRQGEVISVKRVRVTQGGVGIWAGGLTVADLGWMPWFQGIIIWVSATHSFKSTSSAGEWNIIFFKVKAAQHINWLLRFCILWWRVASHRESCLFLPPAEKLFQGSMYIVRPNSNSKCFFQTFLESCSSSASYLENWHVSSSKTLIDLKGLGSECKARDP